MSIQFTAWPRAFLCCIGIQLLGGEGGGGAIGQLRLSEMRRGHGAARGIWADLRSAEGACDSCGERGMAGPGAWAGRKDGASYYICLGAGKGPSGSGFGADRRIKDFYFFICRV